MLEKRITDFLPEAEKLYDDATVTDLTLRFQMAEIIREKLLKRVKEELPFTTAVLVDTMEERSDSWEPEGEEGEGEGGGEKEWGDEAHASLDESTGTDISSASGFKGASKAPEARIQPDEKIRPKQKPSSLGGSDSLQKPSEKQRPTKVTYIRAAIFVERDNQRGIIIGRNGRVIKEIGIEARREIEKILDSIVYLDLKVTVRKRWRDSAEVLDLIEGQR